MEEAAAAKFGRRLLTFRVAGEHLAVPASDVSEVIRPPALTRVPLSPASLSGVANLRGAVLPVVSLRKLMGSGGGGTAPNPRVVVVDRGTPVGLAVDEVTALTAGDGPDEGSQGSDGATGPRLIDIAALLDQTFMDLGRRSAPSLSREPTRPVSEEPPVEEVTLLSFGVAGQDYALPLERVREVVALPAEVVTLPGADEAARGLVTLRGSLLPLVSLRAILGLPAEDRRAPTLRIVVAEIGGSAIGLVADSMKEILRVPAEDIDPVPAVLARGRGESEIQGICRIDGGRRLVSILSPDRLLRDAARSGYLAGGGQKGNDMVADEIAADESEQFVVFRLGEGEYGLPIAAVEEIVRVPETLTRVPNAPAFVAGIMNLRGKVVPVIDQRQRFDLGLSGERRKERVMVVTFDGTQAAFVVDGVTEILRVPSRQLRPAPDLASDRSRVVDRIANIDVQGRMILLLDARELLDRAEKDLLAAMAASAPPRSGS